MLPGLWPLSNVHLASPSRSLSIWSAFSASLTWTVSCDTWPTFSSPFLRLNIVRRILGSWIGYCWKLNSFYLHLFRDDSQIGISSPAYWISPVAYPRGPQNQHFKNRRIVFFPSTSLFWCLCIIIRFAQARTVGSIIDSPLIQSPHLSNQVLLSITPKYFCLSLYLHPYYYSPCWVILLWQKSHLFL